MYVNSAFYKTLEHVARENQICVQYCVPQVMNIYSHNLRIQVVITVEDLQYEVSNWFLYN